MRGALDVEVLLRGTTEHEREHDLHEEVGLEVGLGRDRLGEPRLDLVLPGLGDRVALAVRTGSRLSLAGDRLPVPREAGEGGVHLAEGKRPAAAEVGVVVALQVVAVARFTIEEPEEGHRNAHTSREYSQCIRAVNSRLGLGLPSRWGSRDSEQASEIRLVPPEGNCGWRLERFCSAPCTGSVIRNNVCRGAALSSGVRRSPTRPSSVPRGREKGGAPPCLSG